MQLSPQTFAMHYRTVRLALQSQPGFPPSGARPFRHCAVRAVRADSAARLQPTVRSVVPLRTPGWRSRQAAGCRRSIQTGRAAPEVRVGHAFHVAPELPAVRAVPAAPSADGSAAEGFRFARGVRPARFYPAGSSVRCAVCHQRLRRANCWHCGVRVYRICRVARHVVRRGYCVVRLVVVEWPSRARRQARAVHRWRQARVFGCRETSRRSSP